MLINPQEATLFIGNVTDWVILLVVALVLFGGASKIPQLAKAIGRAMGEFKKGQAEIEKEIRGLATEHSGTSTLPAATSGSTQNVDDALITAAKSLGIETEGKTRDQIGREIAQKTQQK